MDVQVNASEPAPVSVIVISTYQRGVRLPKYKTKWNITFSQCPETHFCFLSHLSASLIRMHLVVDSSVSFSSLKVLSKCMAYDNDGVLEWKEKGSPEN